MAYVTGDQKILVRYCTLTPLEETGYGSGQHFLVVLTAENKRDLIRYVASRKYRRLHEGERPGQAYARGLKALRYIKGDTAWQAVCIESTYYDI